MKIGIVGCAGRMGRMLLKQVMETEGCEVSGGTERNGSPFEGTDLGVLAGLSPMGIVATTDTQAVFAASDAIIDFTSPAATCAHAKLAVETQTAMVIGTTGMTPDDVAVVRSCSEKTPIMQAANMSMGVTLLCSLVEQAAAALTDDFDIEIVEMHHKHKVDAPSGTALAIGVAAASGRDVDLDAVSQRVRDGITGERKRGDIGFATLRGGDVVGEHTAMFASEGERIELTHRATDRRIFAAGAVRAAKWLGDKDAGMFNMKDVLGLK